MDVPLPFNTPVMLVVIVIAGVDVLLATVPVKPFALATLTLVTVPAAAPTQLNTPPVVLDNTYPVTPGNADGSV